MLQIIRQLFLLPDLILTDERACDKTRLGYVMTAKGIGVGAETP